MPLAFRKFFCTCALWLSPHSSFCPAWMSLSVATAPTLVVILTSVIPFLPSWIISFRIDLDNSSRFLQNEMFLMAPPCPPATGPLLCSTSWGNYLKTVSAGCSWFLPLGGPQSHFHSHFSTEQNYLVGWINHQFGI